MLRDFVLILAETEIRVGEARNLKWKDIQESDISYGKGSK
jgi:integrase